MATRRLSDTTGSSSDSDTPANANKLKRKTSDAFDDASSDQLSKVSRAESSYDENYCSRESEDETKDDHGFGAPNFYDTNYHNDKFDDEMDKKSQNSYYQDNSDSSNDVKVKMDLSSSETEEAPKPNSIAERMMKKMGFEFGKGLGKQLQGRVEPVQASKQKGRRGLGLELDELKKAQVEFDPEQEIIEVQEPITWLENGYEDLPLDEEVTEWENERQIGMTPETVESETTYCEEIIVKNVVNAKSVFNRLDKIEMQEARTRSNPFETIRGSIFQNRAAVKMANIDRACNFMFTNPPNLQQNELLYFADVCAGPGGFSEYVLWRKKWKAKGFGFTLKNSNDFKLHDFIVGPCETFHTYYGPDGTGDVYKPRNQIALRDLIMSQTGDQGVHFMMADGGFSVEGKENIQEILSKQLYLCQCLVALMIVRTGGHFVTKLFDIFTPFSVGLIYIMYRCFNRISIFKPNTSRPANSERYLICQGKQPNVDYIANYLFRTNEKLLKVNKMNDILELVPEEKLLLDTKFFNYVKTSNEELGRKQIVGLKKIAAYTENKTLIESKQKLMREQCLKYWGLPEESRKIQPKVSPTTKVQSLLQDSFKVLEKVLPKHATLLTKENIGTVLTNELDWFCLPCSSGESAPGPREDQYPTFYLGMGRSQVYKYTDGQWKSLTDIQIDLPRDTLVYAELVAELKNEEKSQTKTYGLHILDAFHLGPENISQKHFSERHQLIELFCKSLWKPTDTIFTPVRAKELIPVDLNLGSRLKFETKTMKTGRKVKAYFPHKHSYENNSNNPYYYLPRSIIFFKATEEPWFRHFSKSNQLFYYYNIINKKSIWDRDLSDEAKAKFAKVIQTRILWKWPLDDSLTMNDFISYLEKKNQRAK